MHIFFLFSPLNEKYSAISSFPVPNSEITTNFNGNVHDEMLQLAGWGKTENKTSSDALLYAQVQYIDYGHCISEVPLDFRHYVTPDKFCAGFSNGKLSTSFVFI